MLRRMLGWMLLVGSISGVARGQSCEEKPGDKAAVAETVRSMFAAAMKDDVAAFDRLIVPGFYMFDGGRRFDGDEIMQLIKGMHEKGVAYVWNVNDPDVHVHCNEAWIAYVNHGSVKAADQPVVPVTWLESGVLEKQGGVWKIVFFHSTRAAEPTPAK